MTAILVCGSNPNLYDLLDPATNFPSPSFAGDADTLARLRELGLQTQPDAAAALQMARCVETLFRRDVPAASIR